MKWGGLIFFVMVACNSVTNNKTNKAADSLSKAQKTTTKRSGIEYKIGTFLITCDTIMKYDVINEKHPAQSRVSKGDTLYVDADTLILGDLSKLNSEGIFKKYIPKYTFSMFSINTIYKGPLAKPDFKSDPPARGYRTVIRTGCQDTGVNFAGHYIITEWGMGCMCQGMAIVDRKTGKICYSKIPFDTLDGHYGISYTLNSKMVIVNSSLLDYYPGYCLCNGYRKLCFYIWENDAFKKLDGDIGYINKDL